MLLAIALSNLVYLLLPAVISASVTTPGDSANLSAYDVKRLSTPLKNLLPQEKNISLAGTPSGPNAITLNSTSGIEETLGFEEAIDIPGLGRSIYFLVCEISASFQRQLVLES